MLEGPVFELSDPVKRLWAQSPAHNVTCEIGSKMKKEEEEEKKKKRKK